MRHVAFTVLLLIVAAGGGWLLGQQQVTPIPQGLLSGADFGIRVEGPTREGNKLVGTLMVRMKSGEWREIVLGQPGVVPLGSR